MQDHYISNIMSNILHFSVYENNYSKLFELNSTKEIQFPAYQSNESFIGRKCFEFEWKSGRKGFAVGISSVSSKSKAFFYGGLETDNEKFISRDEEANQANDKIEQLSINFTQNKRYMICFDMLINKLILINENQIYSYDHVYEPNTKWKVLFHQGNYTMKDNVIGYFHHNDFKNPLPVAFYSLIDNRSYDFKSIKSLDFMISTSLFLVNILYKS